MLVLSRRIGEKVVIQPPGRPPVTLVVAGVARGKVRLGIDAPRDVDVARAEILDAPPAGERPAIATTPEETTRD